MEKTRPKKLVPKTDTLALDHRYCNDRIHICSMVGQRPKKLGELLISQIQGCLLMVIIGSTPITAFHMFLKGET